MVWVSVLSLSFGQLTKEHFTEAEVVAPLPFAESYQGIVVHDSTAMAISKSRGDIAVSRDAGETWTRSRIMGMEGSMHSCVSLVEVATGRRLYVVASYSTIASSYDLETWTVVEYSGGLTMAANDQRMVIGTVVGKVLTSENAVDWTEVEVPDGTDRISQIAHGPGGFVAAARSERALFSADGLVWELVIDGLEAFPDDDLWFRRAGAANGLFLVSGDQQVTMQSANGRDWEMVDMGDKAWNWKHVVWTGEEYLVTGDTFRLLVSPDMRTFEEKSGVLGSVTHIGQFGDRLIAAGRFGLLATTSVDQSDNWREQASRLGNHFTSVAYGNERFVALDSGRLWMSEDGVRWQLALEAGLASGDSLAFGNGRFVTLGVSNMVYVSVDGVTWEAQGVGADLDAQLLRFLNGRFVAMSPSVGMLAHSADGVTWEPVMVTDMRMADMAYDGSHYVYVGYSSQVYTSTDLTNWSPQPFAVENKTISKLAAKPGELVAIAGEPYRSVDHGQTWVPIADVGQVFASGLAYEPDLGYVALARQSVYFGGEAVSGERWSRETLPTIGGMNDYAFGKDILVMVGGNGTILSSSAPAVLEPPLTGYEAWKADHLVPGDIVAPEGDADGDGRSNLIEYVFGGLPAGGPDIAAGETLRVERSPLGVEVEWQERFDLPDAEVRLQYSADLVTWDEKGVLRETRGGGTWHQVSAKITGAVVDSAALYVRLVVE